MAMSKTSAEKLRPRAAPDSDELPVAAALVVAVASEVEPAPCPPESVGVAEVVPGNALPVASATCPHCDA
jgi:hypothetical protein